MSEISIQFTPEGRFELAFASVIEGKETQLFAEYFPAVGPILGEYGGKPAASFVVLKSWTTQPRPTIGALFQWPSISAYHSFHQDKRFLDIKGLRDDALAHLSNGHFFGVDIATTVTFDTDESYAALLVPKNFEVPSALMTLPLAANSTKQRYANHSLVIINWEEAADVLGSIMANSGEIYKFKFNPPKPA
ncbi:hypothetical protein DL239_19895 [Sedimentitalea sp. CY04]|uniref:Uncharacterized protein n=1 Tax=Parasedimentitalea denitrificans TaxID=2211118 RepID=A0ABX0WC63_9RHOB|nr:hypothetical protein [Sedimentitalea sp. CY04]NIZ63232.1 hypothetical protein [Sedimentitalea sp. CY04]